MSTAYKKFFAKVQAIKVTEADQPIERPRKVHEVFKMKPQGYANKLEKLGLSHVFTCPSCESPRASANGFEGPVKRCKAGPVPVPMEYLEIPTRDLKWCTQRRRQQVTPGPGGPFIL